MGGQVSVESVDMAVVHLCDLDEGGTLGFLAPPRSEKPVQAACLSRESNKKPPLAGRFNTSWGLVFDRIGETGFEPAASCSQSKRATKLRHSPTSEIIVLNGLLGHDWLLGLFQLGSSAVIEQTLVTPLSPLSPHPLARGDKTT